MIGCDVTSRYIKPVAWNIRTRKNMAAHSSSNGYQPVSRTSFTNDSVDNLPEIRNPSTSPSPTSVSALPSPKRSHSFTLDRSNEVETRNGKRNDYDGYGGSYEETMPLHLLSQEDDEDEDGDEAARDVTMRDDDPIKTPMDGGTILESFLNMANSIIGAGIIGLPYSFREAGFWMGLLLLVSLTWTVDWTVRLLMHNGKLAGCNTYQDLMYFCFGHAGLIAISMFQFVFAFGAMCAYSVILGDTIPHVVLSLFPRITSVPILYLFTNRRFVIAFFTCSVSYPLSLYRDMTKLAKTSALALVAIVIIIASVIIEGPRMPPELRGSRVGAFDFVHAEVFQAIGVISFAFVCHHNSFLIFGSLKQPSLNRFALVTHLSMFISLLACLMLALGGYAVFTDRTTGNILNNFPQNDFIINIARFCFGLNMFTTLPLETFVCREVIEHYFYHNRTFSLTRHVILTTLLVLVSMLIALVTCNLGFVLELTGGFSATALAFILPPMCYLRLASGPVLTLKKLPHLVCIAFGAVVMVLSTFFSLQKALTPGGEEGGCDA
ncbi:amino acid transporter [Jimgerdemannia flammicorona]|uniref:Amino acid transporter n=1 Tax=Jimgerdemannia flammicorona TaxID=994334 RepID=A0A433QRT3_9FUNG|nr:amino acid transporter [Jimgerdemannia flammicorona]